MNFITEALKYIINDPFFWPSMGFTVVIGIFIGAVLYDGEVKSVKKMVASLACYASLIVSVCLSRVLPKIHLTSIDKIHQPLASAETIIMVTIFYLIGTYLGVKITKHAHKQHIIL